MKQLNDIAEDLYDELQKFSGALEEGTRNVLAECLGRTVVAKPSLCKKLQVCVTNCLKDFKVRLDLENVWVDKIFNRRDVRMRIIEFDRLNYQQQNMHVIFKN